MGSLIEEGISREEKDLSEGVVSVSLIAQCVLLLQFQFRLFVSIVFIHLHTFSYLIQSIFSFPFSFTISFSMHTQISNKKKNTYFLKSDLWHFRWFSLQRSNLALFRFPFQHVARKIKENY